MSTELEKPRVPGRHDKVLTLEAAALQYAQAGHPVFGLQPGTKIPYLKTRGSLDASTDLARVRQWWTSRDVDDGTAHGDTNIGSVPNDDEYVIDVDVRNDGYATLADRAIQLGPLADTTPTARTPTGGRHFWVGYEGGELRNTIGPGVDIKSHSGYAVMPPSVIEVFDGDHPSGLPPGSHQYAWEVP